jgi:maleamate amidohydrolase
MPETPAAIYRRRGLGRAQAAIRRPCLIVVDLSYGFTDPATPLGCDAADALAATAELLRAARAHDVTRVFTRIAYEDADREVAAPFIEKIPALGALVRGDRLSEIDAAVAPQPGEPVLTKLFASAFFGTPLAAMLDEAGCDGVIVTGATTSGCVRATVVDAMQHGRRVLVPAAAVVDRARAPHDAALFDIQAKYGQVVELDEALAVLTGTPARTAGGDA